MSNTYKGKIKSLKQNEVFVFGSNTEGKHGLGAALFAKQKCGAIYGQSMGLQGQSYAIITKDLNKKIHPSIDKKFIIQQISELYYLASIDIDKKFYIAYDATSVNLNGYANIEMAGMFHLATETEVLEFNHYFKYENSN